MKISLLLSVSLLLLLSFGSQDAQAAKASTTSTLHLTILPAVEVVYLGASSDQEINGLTKEIALGIRANTDWALSYRPISYGFAAAASCSASQDTGPSNGRAGVGDGYQVVWVTCYQPISWSDQQDGYLEVAASASPALGLS